MNVVRKIIQSVEKKKPLPKISLLQGIQMLDSAWDALSTIVNGFRKSGIPTGSQENAIAEDDDPFPELEGKIEDLCSIQPYLRSLWCQYLCRCWCWSYSCATSTFWCRNCRRASWDGGFNDDDDYYSSEVDDKPVKCPDKNELLQVIETLQRSSLFLEKEDKIQSYASCIESQVDQKKQVSIRDFLNKKSCFKQWERRFFCILQKSQFYLNFS